MGLTEFLQLPPNPYNINKLVANWDAGRTPRPLADTLDSYLFLRWSCQWELGIDGRLFYFEDIMAPIPMLTPTVMPVLQTERGPVCDLTASRRQRTK